MDKDCLAELMNKATLPAKETLSYKRHYPQFVKIKNVYSERLFINKSYCMSSSTSGRWRPSTSPKASAPSSRLILADEPCTTPGSQWFQFAPMTSLRWSSRLRIVATRHCTRTCILATWSTMFQPVSTYFLLLLMLVDCVFISRTKAHRLK